MKDCVFTCPRVTDTNTTYLQSTHLCIRAQTQAAEVLDRLYDREVSSLTKLQHPNVVQLMGVGTVAPR